MFTVYLGPQKVVVLAGYKAVKEALVNNAEEFGDRDHFVLAHELSKGHGKEIQIKGANHSHVQFSLKQMFVISTHIIV